MAIDLDKNLVRDQSLNHKSLFEMNQPSQALFFDDRKDNALQEWKKKVGGADNIDW